MVGSHLSSTSCLFSMGDVGYIPSGLDCRPYKRVVRKTRPEVLQWRLTERGPPMIPRSPSVNFTEMRRQLKVESLVGRHRTVIKRYQEVADRRDHHQRKLEKHARRRIAADAEMRLLDQEINVIRMELEQSTLVGREQCSVM